MGREINFPGFEGWGTQGQMNDLGGVWRAVPSIPAHSPQDEVHTPDSELKGLLAVSLQLASPSLTDIFSHPCLPSHTQGPEGFAHWAAPAVSCSWNTPLSFPASIWLFSRLTSRRSSLEDISDPWIPPLELSEILKTPLRACHRTPSSPFLDPKALWVGSSSDPGLDWLFGSCCPGGMKEEGGGEGGRGAGQAVQEGESTRYSTFLRTWYLVKN